MSFRGEHHKKLKERNRVRDLYRADLDAARKARDRDKVQMIMSEARNEEELFEFDRALFLTESLVTEAESWLVPIPPREETLHWMRDEKYERFLLTPEGIRHLHNAIRLEKKAHREAAFAWLEVVGKVAAILTGLGGVLIGLVSVWPKG